MTAPAPASSAYELEWINGYVGVPFLENGRDRNGWDCWGLVLAVYREQLGVELPDWQWAEPFGLSSKFRAFGDAIGQVLLHGHAGELEAPEPWAIALILNGGRPHHVGVVAGGGVLHAARYGGTVFEPRARFLRTYSEATWWRWRK